MRWLETRLPPVVLRCAYCDREDAFPHVKSYAHAGEMLSLHGCTGCGSLIYDMAGIEAPVVSDCDMMSPATARAARYVLEAGFSAHHVALCALSALPNLPHDALGEYLFVDVGAGMGMASWFAQRVAGVETLTVEPSYTGRLAQEILGLEVHRAYFEDLPEPVRARLATRRCLLHLNSVVEHLLAPRQVLAGMMGIARIEQVAMIVPDGGDFDFDAPFVAALPFLAPRDHRHLPTAEGMRILLRDLGFAHQHVRRTPGLLIAIGGREPVAPPDERAVRFGERLLLEQMLRHPHPQVATGGASRLVPQAVLQRDAPLIAVLRENLPYERDAARLAEYLRQDDWDALPYDVGTSSYWLAYDAMAAGRLDGALALLELTVAFADRIAVTHPDFAMTPLEFKWAGLLLRAHILELQGDTLAALGAVGQVLESRHDTQNGARRMYLDQAEAALNRLAGAELAAA